MNRHYGELWFNSQFSLVTEEVAENSEDTIDLEVFRQGAGKAVVQQISYLVDMAKAEALDDMGENREALELVARYL